MFTFTWSTNQLYFPYEGLVDLYMIYCRNGSMLTSHQIHCKRLRIYFVSFLIPLLSCCNLDFSLFVILSCICCDRGSFDTISLLCERAFGSTSTQDWLWKILWTCERSHKQTIGMKKLEEKRYTTTHMRTSRI